MLRVFPQVNNDESLIERVNKNPEKEQSNESQDEYEGWQRTVGILI
jgi:hypothetical protein